MASPAVERVGVHCAADRPVSRELARIRSVERVERTGEERATTGSPFSRGHKLPAFLYLTVAKPNRSALGHKKDGSSFPRKVRRGCGICSDTR